MPIKPTGTILLVEDNRINQRFAMLVLSKAGYDVEVAVNGRQGVDMALARDYLAILMDIQMPILDGIGATQEIRARASHRVPIIGVSAHALAASRNEAMAAGMDAYISKPFQPESLLQAIEAVLAGASDPTPNTEPSTLPVEAFPHLDENQLHHLASVFTLGKVYSLARLYILDIDARLKLIEDFRLTRDREGIARQAHAIVSMAGNVGAHRTSMLARLVEEMCAERAATDESVRELRQSAIISAALLRRWLARHEGMAFADISEPQRRAAR